MIRKFLSAVISLSLIVTCGGCSNSTPAESTQSSVSNSAKMVIPEDSFLNDNFNYVCSEVGIDINGISAFEKTADWSGGPRYTFVYEKAPFTLYCNTDSTIESLNIGDSEDLFKRGFESYNVNDYICTDDEKVSLQINGEDAVKLYLNYPDTANFHTMDWAYGKDHDLLHVSGTVTAKNAFGVKDDIKFSVIFRANNDSMSAVYVSLNDSVQLNNLKQDTPERATVEDDSQVSNGSAPTVSSDALILEDGVIGEYGQEDKVGSETYIDFYIPAGEYEITNLSSWCIVNIIDNNSNETATAIELADMNSKSTMTITDNQHIELTVNGKVSLSPMN